MAIPMVDIPVSWSNAGRKEKLRKDAYESLTRMLPRAVADTGENFQIWDALRARSEQIALFKKHYRYTGRKYKTSPNDRWYNGTVWAWRGSVRVASPDLGSNHEDGVAIDAHPKKIQDWIKKNGLAHGWSWEEGKRNKEDWHMRYYPALDQYKSEGFLDHGAVQIIVGATVDHKIGTGTVEKIKKYQEEHGLEADGKVGPDTKRAMGLVDFSKPTEEVEVKPTAKPTTSEGFRYTYSREEWETEKMSDKIHPFDHEVKGVFLHYPGAGNVTLGNESVEQTMRRLRAYREDHVKNNNWYYLGYNVAFDQRGYSYELRGAGNEPGANGGSETNNSYVAFLLLLGNNEEPSQAMVDGVNAFLAQVGEAFVTAKELMGHRQSWEAKTSCPGEPVMIRIQNGTFNFNGAPGATSGEAVNKPSSGGLPTGKDLLMKLVNVPDFPLLRTEAHKCYYGNEKPLESVSGKMENSLNPGEIVDDGAEGLRTFQSQMNERGYNLKVDGRFANETEKAVKNLQRLAGLTQDGKIGPHTWFAAWLLPVQ